MFEGLVKIFLIFVIVDDIDIVDDNVGVSNGVKLNNLNNLIQGI